MDYTYLQRYGVDSPLMEERNMFSSASAQGLCQYPTYASPSPPFSWSAPDPALLQINEHAWSNGVKTPPPGIIGLATDGHFLPHQRPRNIVTQNSQFNVPADVMAAAISSDSFRFGPGGDAVVPHAQWRQMCSLSSEEFLNDAIPQLISDFTVPQPCLYTSSSDCPHEADSSGSSERDRSCFIGSPSDTTNWKISDVLHENLRGSTSGFALDALPNGSPFVAADLDTLDSGRHALSSLISMDPGPAGDCIPHLWPTSWMSPRTIESSNVSTVTGQILNQEIPNLDSLISHSSSSCKRQRASYTLENSCAEPLSKPKIASVSSSPSTNLTSGSDEYPVTSLNATDALYKDFHVSRRRTLALPKPAVCEALGGSATKSDHQLGDDDLKFHRKLQNATSIEPQSVAARHRRRKISDRVRVLEKLIPGGNKMDTASMLDESIEYVKFLQLQVHLLETFGDSSDGIPSLSGENVGRGKDELDTRPTCSFGSQASKSCTAVQLVRPAASPLILSEILQEQLFKQKLCLVSLRQCLSTTRSSASETLIGFITD